mgnify:CR=1 FL=1
MRQDITFIPLGGGQRVGASCYYLRIGEANVILDAGTGQADGVEFGPNYHFLMTSPFLQSMGQINQIFISHAHMDHIGDLMNLMRQTRHANVFMTEATKVLTEYQLYDRLFVGCREHDENTRLAVMSLLEQIVTVSFMQTIDFGSYKVTFYPAGHMPGAMMMLFEVGKRKILYTGDYSLNSTGLTPGCMLPDVQDIDVVILCGLHAKHPGYTKKSDAMFKEAAYILRTVGSSGQSIMCRVPQLSKGIEFLKKLNDWNISEIPIYLDESVMNIVRKMEQLSVPILTSSDRIMGIEQPPVPHIYLTSSRSNRYTDGYRCILVDFSLHEDFSEMKIFLKKFNPKQAIVVHCGKEFSVFDHTIEQEMMLDGECCTQFVFAEENEIYKL